MAVGNTGQCATDNHQKHNFSGEKKWRQNSNVIRRAFAVLHEDEDVHGPDLGDLVVVAYQPKALLATLLLGHFLKIEEIGASEVAYLLLTIFVARFC